MIIFNIILLKCFDLILAVEGVCQQKSNANQIMLISVGAKSILI